MGIKLRKRPCQTASFSGLILKILITEKPETQIQKQRGKQRKREKNRDGECSEQWKKKKNCRERFRPHGPNNGSNQCASSHATIFGVDSSPRAVIVGRQRLRIIWKPSSPSSPTASVVVWVRCWLPWRFLYKNFEILVFSMHFIFVRLLYPWCLIDWIWGYAIFWGDWEIPLLIDDWIWLEWDKYTIFYIVN